VVELSQRYIKLFEMITGTTFTPPDPAEDVDERVARNVQRALEELK
jgi:phosphoribosylaminoimidazole-succinocarboxamide synthase